MTRLRALVRKEVIVLFGSPMAWIALTLVALVTALIFYDHLRIYNQILFLYATSTMGGFESDTVPDYINLRDTVFFPVMETLGITLLGIIPLVTMRVFAEERARGTDELLLTTRLSPGAIVVAKFAVAYAFVTLAMVVSFVYPAMAVSRGGVGVQHLLSVFVGLLLHALAVASIGLVCSAFTKSQLIAAIAGFAAGFVLWDFSWAGPFVGERLFAVLDAISIHPRYGAFSEGVVRVSHLVYFAGLACVAAALARLSFDWRRVAG
ncbi:MAG: ABC transporter permease [Myxococcota bacterium]|nr:ABC transporter permease [Myxococcota bacterium]